MAVCGHYHEGWGQKGIFPAEIVIGVLLQPPFNPCIGHGHLFQEDIGCPHRWVYVKIALTLLRIQAVDQFCTQFKLQILAEQHQGRFQACLKIPISNPRPGGRAGQGGIVKFPTHVVNGNPQAKGFLRYRKFKPGFQYQPVFR